MSRSSQFHRTSRSAAAAPVEAPAWRLWLLIALAALPLPLFAQELGQGGNGYFFRRPLLSFSLRGGYDRPRASSDVFDFATTQLTLNKGDLAAGGYRADIGVRLAERVELVISGGQSVRTAGSEFRKYVDNNDLPIEQTTKLSRVPLSLGFQYALTAPGERISRFAWIPSRITPWVGAGAGAMNYIFQQNGDFVDFQTLNVFRQEYRSSGWAPMGYANLGAEVRLTTRVSFTGDLRYTASRATLGGTFVGFDKIDLSGTAATMGLTVRM